MGDKLTLNELESELSREIRELRRNPRAFADYLQQERRPRYEGRDLKLAHNTVLKTQEGVAACDEAIRFLMNAVPLEPFAVAYGMCLAAKEAVGDVGPTGKVASSPDGICINKLGKFGEFDEAAVEICSYGGVDAKGLLSAFLICDGEPKRTHRKALFETKWTHIGVGAGDHNSEYKIMACVCFSKNWRDF
ncbi:hypothetical protein QOT17_019156 [Balamuthia mandrillaris]